MQKPFHTITTTESVSEWHHKCDNPKCELRWTQSKLIHKLKLVCPDCKSINDKYKPPKTRAKQSSNNTRKLEIKLYLCRLGELDKSATVNLQSVLDYLEFNTLTYKSLTTQEKTIYLQNELLTYKRI